MAITDPSDLSGLVLWLDAADSATITETAGEVSQWDDKSTSGHDFSQGTAADQPNTNTINNKPGVFFDGDDLLASETLASSIDSDGMTFIYVITPTDVVGVGYRDRHSIAVADRPA